MRALPVIQDWAVVERPDQSPYTPPELRETGIHGRVYGRDGFNDGEYITTTSVIDTEPGNVIVTRSGSRYRLAQVRPDYEAAYPNAEARVFKKRSSGVLT